LLMSMRAAGEACYDGPEVEIRLRHPESQYYLPVAGLRPRTRKCSKPDSRCDGTVHLKGLQYSKTAKKACY
jgi:hypothetical protein